MIRRRVFKTAWGFCGIVAGPRGLRATYLPQTDRIQIERLIRRDYPESRRDASLLPKLVRSISAYFEGQPVRFSNVRMDFSGLTEFRRRVLEACRKIPRGKTATYADLARAAGSPGASRAVGSAMANNPLPLVVPCHRVLRSDGSLGGFSSPRGVRQKKELLKLEGAL
jgi:methylated-DNA-[protein]-cysteine S-methyltransferase